MDHLIFRVARVKAPSQRGLRDYRIFGAFSGARSIRGPVRASHYPRHLSGDRPNGIFSFAPQSRLR
jgi:hypothetical protein